MKIRYYHNLDGLRAIAAFGVIICHFFSIERTKSIPWFYGIAQQGNSGVSLFFVLSGFVITRILLQKVNQPKYFLNFYVRRALRIFPLYYLGLLVYIFMPLLLRSVEHLPPVSALWYHFVYLQNFARTFNWIHYGPGHYWSLAVEEHFYLIWPAVIYVYRNKPLNNLLMVSIALILLAAGLRWLMFSKGMEINVFTFTRMDQLSMGCILAIAERKKWLEVLKSRNIFLTMFIVGVLTVLLCNFLPELFLQVFKHFAYGFMFFSLIGYCITSSTKNILNRVLNSYLMQFLGKISYGLYVWHMLVLVVFEHYFKPGFFLLDFLWVSLGIVVLSALSFFLFEKKFLSLKSYFGD